MRVNVQDIKHLKTIPLQFSTIVGKPHHAGCDSLQQRLSHLLYLH